MSCFWLKWRLGGIQRLDAWNTRFDFKFGFLSSRQETWRGTSAIEANWKARGERWNEFIGFAGLVGDSGRGDWSRRRIRQFEGVVEGRLGTFALAATEEDGSSHMFGADWY